MRALAILLLLAPSVLAQSPFTDADFEFVIAPPPGMSRLTDAELATFQGRPLEEVAVVPRAESESGSVIHNYFWRDDAKRGRELSLILADGPPPFGTPEQLIEASEKELGLTVDIKEPLQPPVYAPGLRVEGSRTRADGQEMRVLVAYYILGQDPLRWGMLRLQGPAADWTTTQPEFLDTVASIKFPHENMLRQTPKPSGFQARTGRGTSQDWTGLEVTGSLVLAAALLMSLFFGGRGGA